MDFVELLGRFVDHPDVEAVFEEGGFRPIRGTAYHPVGPLFGRASKFVIDYQSKCGLVELSIQVSETYRPSPVVYLLGFSMSDPRRESMTWRRLSSMFDLPVSDVPGPVLAGDLFGKTPEFTTRATFQGRPSAESMIRVYTAVPPDGWATGLEAECVSGRVTKISVVRGLLGGLGMRAPQSLPLLNPDALAGAGIPELNSMMLNGAKMAAPSFVRTNTSTGSAHPSGLSGVFEACPTTNPIMVMRPHQNQTVMPITSGESAFALLGRYVIDQEVAVQARSRAIAARYLIAEFPIDNDGLLRRAGASYSLDLLSSPSGLRWRVDAASNVEHQLEPATIQRISVLNFEASGAEWAVVCGAMGWPATSTTFEQALDVLLAEASVESHTVIMDGWSMERASLRAIEVRQKSDPIGCVVWTFSMRSGTIPEVGVELRHDLDLPPNKDIGTQAR